MGADENPDAARRWTGVADAAPVLLDADGVITGWTGNARRLLAYPAAEVVGTRLARLLGEEDAARLPGLLARCRDDGGWAGLLTARRRDGLPVKLMVRVSAAADGQGPSRWLLLMHDADRAPAARGWDLDRGVLEQMVAGSPIGIAIVDTDLRFVWSNAALARFGGGAPASRLGMRLADVQPGVSAEPIEAIMRRVLATGEPVLGYEHGGRIRSAPHRETAHMMSFNRLDDDHGRPMGVYYTVIDVTDRHRARQRLALLDRAGQRIGSSLDPVRTGQELADAAVPDFADLVAVDLLESVLRGAEPAPDPRGGARAGPLRRVGHRSVDEGVPGAVAGVGDPAGYLPGSPPLRALATGRPWRETRLDPSAGEWASRAVPGPDVDGGAPPPRPDAADGPAPLPDPEPGPHSVLVVPLRARGVTLGVTTFFRRHRQEPFDADDLSLAEDLVSRAAVCVDNARRYTRERDAALGLQRSLLPRRLPEQDAGEVAACYRPADELTGLGGDWYDLIPLSGARVALVVGEVPGYGIDAAAAMGRLRTAVRTLAALDLPPDEVLAHLDDLVARADGEEGAAADPPAGQDAQQVGSGCLYVVYDPVDGRCAMAAAGHPAPAVVLPDGHVRFVDLPQGPALGTGGPPFEAVELCLPDGSTLALHTDGLLARGGQGAPDADRDRLRRALERQAASLELRCRALIDALVPDRPHDDVALLMARTRRLGAERVAEWEVPADPAAVADARRAASRRLAEWGLEELAFTTELVVSELVTNAIRHADGPIRVRLLRGRTLVCEVYDGGATAPHLRHPRTTDEGGRGLLLVSRFTRRWGTRFTPEGKIIWAEQPLDGGAGGDDGEGCG
ncbi:SpoIIE family protein phosphatase [Streptomyces galbus]|uniref:SpoIIE family protein phosphatase n=1 Tax=Streptomyces galbus TaxID=33898 RepID=A0ABX1IN93_STRGB|nr:SpoIIE family protein phosphatase [Streptomyces galbus]NKQ27093.1 SpoIIE family protein phosphatase [Streptomyces galbus]